MWSTSNTVIFFLLQGLMTACAMQEPTPTTATPDTPSAAQTVASQEYNGAATAIQLEKAVHFSTPEGGDMVAAPGRYQLEPTTEAHLRLVPESAAPPFVIAATPTSFDLDISAPVALTIPGSEDLQHVVLLLPGGTALDGIGSYSGTRSRGAFAPLGSASVGATLTAKLRQNAPPVLSGPGGSPTGGGVNSLVVNPSPAVVGHQIGVTLKGWGICGAIQFSFGDNQTFSSATFYDVDFTKTGSFTTVYSYRTQTQPGQSYTVTAVPSPTGTKPCTGQATAKVEVKPPSTMEQLGAANSQKMGQPAANQLVPHTHTNVTIQLAPTVTSVWTAGIRPGELVNIVGKDFGTQPGRVRLIRDLNQQGDLYLDITDWKDAFVQGRVPANYPARDTDPRGLQVFNSRNQGSNLWSVHSGVVIEEEAMDVPPGVVKPVFCAKPSCYVNAGGVSFGGQHSSSSKAVFPGSGSGTDTYSISLANGWRIHSCRYLPNPSGIDGAIQGCEPGLKEATLAVKWFYDVASSAMYFVQVTVVGPKGVPPW